MADRVSTPGEVFDSVAGFGPLQRWLDDLTVEEIWINERLTDGSLLPVEEMASCPAVRACRRRFELKTLVLVLTDVQGSTRLWQDEPVPMDAAMARHHEIVHGAVEAHGGWRPVDQGEGDAVFAAFRSASAAVDAVVAVQRELAAERWPTSVPVRVRIGVHVGEVIERDGNLYGDAVNRCARLRGLGHGGQTLLSAPMFELVRDRLPEGVSVTDLGEHRMKDLVRPEHVWQLNVDGLGADFPPLSSLDRVAHNLPVQAAPFIGREEQLRSLVSTVREHRLVTLTGFGGMGKTRLALQAAAELAGEPGIGDVWFVDLSAVTDPDLVPARVAEAASVRSGTRDPLHALVEAFADRPTLLVLDNLEQVIGCARFVAGLVAEAPAVRVLCTSREPLRVRSEQQVPLEPMTIPTQTTGVTAEALSTFEAAQFFVDRACAVRPDFAITDEIAPAVAAICARLDGHPLALELAAARVQVLSVDKLLARLDSALGVLTGGSRDMPERHQTLRATIAWSCDALEAPEQLLLARMSVLTGPADLDLLEAVCGQDIDVLEVLAVLVQRSLVRTLEVGTETRFGLLVSVRDYAAEQLSAADTVVLRDRLVGHLLALFAHVANDYHGFAGVFGREAPHIRAALAHLQQSGQVEREVQLVVALDDVVAHKGHPAENLEMTERALSLTDDPETRARLLLSQAGTFSVMGAAATDLAREAAHDAVVAARAGGDEVLQARAVVAALVGARTLGEFHELRAEYAALCEHLSEVERQPLDGEAAHVLAGHYRYLDPDLAEEQARRFAFAPERGAYHRVQLARILFDTGRVEEGWQVLQPTRDPAGFDGSRMWEIVGAIELARGHLLRGDTDSARELASASLEKQVLRGSVPNVVAALIAQLERRAGNLGAALAVLDRAVALAPGPVELPAATLLWRRALVHHALGDPARARADLDVARPVLAALPLRLLELLGCLATEALVTTDPARAALLLGCIDAHRKSWVLPQDLDKDLAPLRAELALTQPDDLAAGRSLAPHLAAALASTA